MIPPNQGLNTQTLNQICKPLLHRSYSIYPRLLHRSLPSVLYYIGTGAGETGLLQTSSDHLYSLNGLTKPSFPIFLSRASYYQT